MTSVHPYPSSSADQALVQAQIASAGQFAIYAQQKMADMASSATADLEALAALTPAGTDSAKVIDIQPVAIALPDSAKAMLPQSTRMANAALPQATSPSSSAKRRARRAKAKAAASEPTNLVTTLCVIVRVSSYLVLSTCRVLLKRLLWSETR